MARPHTDIEAGRNALLEVVDDLVRKRGAVDISMTDLAAAAACLRPTCIDFSTTKKLCLRL